MIAEKPVKWLHLQTVCERLVDTKKQPWLSQVHDFSLEIESNLLKPVHKLQKI